MAFRYIFTNNAKSDLAAPILATDTAITVKAGDGDKFAVLQAQQGQLVTILEQGVGVEIVQVYWRIGDTLSCNRAREGTTALPFSKSAKVYADLTAGQIQALYDRQTVENLDNGGNPKGLNAINIQPGRANLSDVASGSNAIAIGYSTKATMPNAFACGEWNAVTGIGSTCLGRNSKIASANSFNFGYFSNIDYADYSVAFNKGSNGDMLIAGAQHISSRQTLGELATFPEYNFGTEHQEFCAINTSFLTETLDLVGGKTWLALTAYSHGTYIKPSVANGFMYYWEDSNFPYDKTSVYTPSATGTVEPVWSTVNYGYSQDDAANGYYDAIDPHNYTLTFDMPVKIDAIDIICYQQSGVTINAVISIGTQANPVLLANNVSVILSGNMSVFTVPISKAIVNDLKIDIVNFATGTEQLIRCEISGKYVDRWL